MKSKYQRYTKEIIEGIQDDLENPNIRVASEAAMNRGLDISGYIKHIKMYRILVETSERNKCAKKYICSKRNNACDKCFYISMYNQEKSCIHCRVNCNDICNDFTKIPNCKRITKFPYTCNSCEKKLKCRLNKYIYDSERVWKMMCRNRSESRKGSHASEEEFIRLSNLLEPLIKEKHQSLPQIYQTHKTEIRWSYPTILKFIDKGLIPNIRNIDLTKRVRYPSKYKKNDNEPTNQAFLSGRTYDDFISFMSSNPFVEVVEMDTVLSGRGDNTCLLTLLFRKSNFMLAFKLKRKTSEETQKIFDNLKEILGIELYKETFQCILTDNGSEFADPRAIEFDFKTGEKISDVFYCDPGKSGQKGKIEKNHVELRKVFPKSTFFSIYSQDDINLALCHINSEPRGILNGNCPGIIARVFINPKVIGINNYTFINPDDVVLHPDVFKKK